MPEPPIRINDSCWRVGERDIHQFHRGLVLRYDPSPFRVGEGPVVLVPGDSETALKLEHEWVEAVGVSDAK